LNLEVHHKDFRSKGGDDSEENLITLCAKCHSQVHRCFI
jgi:5-methylcytosine-specific restriction protein A